jgi:hypothetical protein
MRLKRHNFDVIGSFVETLSGIKAGSTTLPAILSLKKMSRTSHDNKGNAS